MIDANTIPTEDLHQLADDGYNFATLTVVQASGGGKQAGHTRCLALAGRNHADGSLEFAIARPGPKKRCRCVRCGQ